MKKPVIIIIILVLLSMLLSCLAVSAERERLPREVWVASVTLMSVFGSHHDPVGTTIDERIERILARMEKAAAYNPDIICLTEAFAYTGLSNLPPLAELAEKENGPVIRRFCEFAKTHACYVVCPVYTNHDGMIFNAAVLIDRKGVVVGEYDKIHPTEGEIEIGITPGPLDPPVFKTDFGTIGIMICFDANWPDKWEYLKDNGAEIVFFPSAFHGGRIINSLAQTNGFYIVTSTRYEPARLVDITGEDVAGNGRLQPWFCAPVNLDRKIFHWDFQEDVFKSIQETYGDAIGYEILHPEGLFILESRSPEVRLDDIIEKYNLVTYDEYIDRAARFQDPAVLRRNDRWLFNEVRCIHGQRNKITFDNTYAEHPEA